MARAAYLVLLSVFPIKPYILGGLGELVVQLNQTFTLCNNAMMVSNNMGYTSSETRGNIKERELNNRNVKEVSFAKSSGKVFPT